jgi:hypothetical protein
MQPPVALPSLGVTRWLERTAVGHPRPLMSPPTMWVGEVMTESEGHCPICGALLIDELRMGDPATGAPVLVWQCEQQHWWRQSFMHGLVPIEPGAIAGEAPTTTEDESGHS